MQRCYKSNISNNNQQDDFKRNNTGISLQDIIDMDLRTAEKRVRDDIKSGSNHMELDPKDDLYTDQLMRSKVWSRVPSESGWRCKNMAIMTTLYPLHPSGSEGKDNVLHFYLNGYVKPSKNRNFHDTILSACKSMIHSEQLRQLYREKNRKHYAKLKSSDESSDPIDIIINDKILPFGIVSSKTKKGILRVNEDGDNIFEPKVTLDNIRDCKRYKKIYLRDLPCTNIIGLLCNSVTTSKRVLTVAIAQGRLKINGLKITDPFMPIYDYMFQKTKLPSGEISHFIMINLETVAFGNKIISTRKAGLLELVDDFGKEFNDIKNSKYNNAIVKGSKKLDIVVDDLPKPFKYSFGNRGAKGLFKVKMSDYIFRIAIKILNRTPPYNNPFVNYKLHPKYIKYLRLKYLFPSSLFSYNDNLIPSGSYRSRINIVKNQFGDKLCLSESDISPTYIKANDDLLKQLDRIMLSKLVNNPLNLDVKACIYNQDNEVSDNYVLDRIKDINGRFFSKRSVYYENNEIPQFISLYYGNEYIDDVLRFSHNKTLEENIKTPPLFGKYRFFYEKIKSCNSISNLKDEYKNLTITPVIEDLISRIIESKDLQHLEKEGLLNLNDLNKTSHFIFPKEEEDNDLCFYDEEKDNINFNDDKEEPILLADLKNILKLTSDKNYEYESCLRSDNPKDNTYHDDETALSKETLLNIDSTIDNLKLLIEDKVSMYGIRSREDVMNYQHLAKYLERESKSRRWNTVIVNTLKDEDFNSKVLNNKNTKFFHYPGYVLTLRGETMDSNVNI